MSILQANWNQRTPSRSSRRKPRPPCLGATRGMIQIKEEPREESSDEHPIIEVKTEPYNTAILDQVGHSHDSTSEGAKESSGWLHVKDELRGTCDHASSGISSSSAQFEIGTTTVEPQCTNDALVITDGRPTEQSSDQSETQVASKSSTFGHEKDRLYKSNICLAACINTGHLEVHVKTHKTKTLTCDKCSATFRHASTLRVHARHCTGLGSQKSNVSAPACASSAHECNLSPAESSHSMCLQRRKRTLVGKKSFRCDLCGFEFNKRYKLRNHKKAHMSAGLYQCTFCPAQFRQSAMLKYHKQKHTGEKAYKCNLCPAEFSHSSSLYVHKRTHTGEKPHKCDLCPAEFNKRYDLQRHRRTHTGEKPYKCDVCPAEFSRSSMLLRHKGTHMGDKPHKCDLCPAEFSERADLRSHRRTHTGKKPYKCNVCPLEFNHMKSLSHHMREHTGEKPYNPVSTRVSSQQQVGKE
ncbi:zinc finger protein 845-like isoform X1 [Ornithodoros turicata]|uniref:zinc finger protein 845-like isoform X1 n=2 Tax=Ornithodoros turicata TaxID=34597 RepID=UPI003138E7D4